MIAPPARVVVVNAWFDLGHQVVVSARLVAHEHHRRDVEGQLLRRRVEQESRVVGDPIVGHDLRSDAVDVLDVAGQAAAGERLLHDAPVVHVLVKVEQHQAPVEERPDDRVPPLLRVVLVAVGEDRLGRVGTQREHRRQDRRLRVCDRAQSCTCAMRSPGRRGTSRRCGPTTGRPASPMTGLRSLPGGGSASVICFHSWPAAASPARPCPGMLFTVGISRRLAWSSRYSGVLMRRHLDAPRIRKGCGRCHFYHPSCMLDLTHVKFCSGVARCNGLQP